MRGRREREGIRYRKRWRRKRKIRGMEGRGRERRKRKDERGEEVEEWGGHIITHQ